MKERVSDMGLWVLQKEIHEQGATKVVPFIKMVKTPCSQLRNSIVL